MVAPTQNEIGGKDLLVKVAQAAKVFSTDATTSTFTSAAHGLAVGTPITFTAADLGTITTILPNVPYFIKTVLSVNTFEIASTPTGTAIIPGVLTTSKNFVPYLSLGGIRTKSFAFKSGAIDITSQDTSSWKKILDNAGERSLALSGSGVYTHEVIFQGLRANAFNNANTDLMFIDVKGLLAIQGFFKITSLDVSGDYAKEGNYSMSAESADVPNVNQLA